MKRSASNQDALEDRERNAVTFELNNNGRVDDGRIRYSPLKSSSSSNLIYQSNKRTNERMRTENIIEFSRQDECVNKKSIPSINHNISNGVEVGVYIQEEIHPGIILEGYAVEI